MKKVILLASGLLCSSLVFASDPAAIDSLINLQGVVISANKVQVNRSSVPLTITTPCKLIRLSIAAGSLA